MPISHQTVSGHNLPKPDDTTADLIRKHKIYSREWQRILNKEIERGKDYWGGYDDTVANGMAVIEEMLYIRAFLNNDDAAEHYIFDTGIADIMSIRKWLRVASDALDALNASDIEKAKYLLTSIRPKPYSSEEPSA